MPFNDTTTISHAIYHRRAFNTHISYTCHGLKQRITLRRYHNFSLLLLPACNSPYHHCVCDLLDGSIPLQHAPLLLWNCYCNATLLIGVPLPIFYHHHHPQAYHALYTLTYRQTCNVATGSPGSACLSPLRQRAFSASARSYLPAGLVNVSWRGCRPSTGGMPWHSITTSFCGTEPCNALPIPLVCAACRCYGNIPQRGLR